MLNEEEITKLNDLVTTYRETHTLILDRALLFKNLVSIEDYDLIAVSRVQAEIIGLSAKREVAAKAIWDFVETPELRERSKSVAKVLRGLK